MVPYRKLVMEINPNDLDDLFHNAHTHLVIEDGSGLTINDKLTRNHRVGLFVDVLNTEVNYNFKQLFLLTPDKAREIGRSLIDHARLADTYEPEF